METLVASNALRLARVTLRGATSRLGGELRLGRTVAFQGRELNNRADERITLAERLFGPDPPVLPGYWTCFHADCEHLDTCRYGCKTYWQDAR